MADADLKNKLDEYNWMTGPKNNLADPDCDLALALRFSIWPGLENQRKELSCKSGIHFITVLYEDILDNRFPKTDASLKFH